MEKILLVEDDKRIAGLIHRVLQEHGFTVSTAYDGEMGKRLILGSEFDLVITDIILPGMSGLDFCQEVKAYRPQLPVIMLTALGRTDDKVEGFDAGADDYLVKPFDFRELIARIRVLLKRSAGTPRPPGLLLKYADLEINPVSRIVTRQGQEIQLTPKEFKLLEYMLEHAERVLPRTEIAEKVWETHFDTGTNFIDVYINYLRKKIDKPFQDKLIHTRPGMGFVLKKE